MRTSHMIVAVLALSVTASSAFAQASVRDNREILIQGERRGLTTPPFPDERRGLTTLPLDVRPESQPGASVTTQPAAPVTTQLDAPVTTQLDAPVTMRKNTDERRAAWTQRCRPQLVPGEKSYNVSRWVYSAPGCEFGP